MTQPTRTVELTQAQLPLHCPMPGDAVWCSHPRVFLDLSAQGEALCPYCGTRYVLKDWDSASRKAAH